MKPMIDNSIPESLTLTHLASRVKKMQIITDRQDEIAVENKKLMIKMTQILTKPPQPKKLYNRIPGRVEMSRRHEIDKINHENSLMFERLKKVTPNVKISKFEQDYKKHIGFRNLIKRRQLKPMSILPSSTSTLLSPNKKSFTSSKFQSILTSDDTNNDLNIPVNMHTLLNGPIAEFRRLVISPKRASNLISGPIHDSIDNMLRNSKSAKSMKGQESLLGTINVEASTDQLQSKYDDDIYNSVFEA